MKRSPQTPESGFTLLEVLVVVTIIAALVSMAVPNYVAYKDKARAAACISNRRSIEMDEADYYTQHQKPSLNIADIYRCPSGGTHVWLVSNPEAAGYPKVGCSLHFIGLDELPDPGTGPPGATDPAPETPAVAPDQALADLSDYIPGLNLKKKTEDKLIKILEKALTHFEKGQIAQADKSLGAFQKEVDKNSGSIDDETESALKQKAENIRDMLKLPR